jgi:SecD/SecF fusion protein
MKKNNGVAIIAVILVCLIGLGYYTSTILSATSTSQAETDNKVESEGIKLGLDLSGGVSITYRIVDDNPSATDINDTVAKLEERAESYSTEYSVYQVGDDRITVEIPGVYDANAVLEDLGSPGSLYFITQTDSDGNSNYSYDSTAGGYVLDKDLETLIADGSVILTGDDVKSANAAYQTDSATKAQSPVVELAFTDSAADIFGDATTAASAAGETIGIYYDDQFISVPSVKEAITSGQCQIDGMSSYDEAEQLATFIRVGAISLELEELESSVSGAQLGGQALTSSVKAGLIGLILVMLYMIFNYSLSGVHSFICLKLH